MTVCTIYFCRNFFSMFLPFFVFDFRLGFSDFDQTRTQHCRSFSPCPMLKFFWPYTWQPPVFSPRKTWHALTLAFFCSVFCCLTQLSAESGTFFPSPNSVSCHERRILRVQSFNFLRELKPSLFGLPPFCPRPYAFSAFARFFFCLPFWLSSTVPFLQILPPASLHSPRPTPTIIFGWLYRSGPIAFSQTHNPHGPP